MNRSRSSMVLVKINDYVYIDPDEVISVELFKDSIGDKKYERPSPLKVDIDDNDELMQEISRIRKGTMVRLAGIEDSKLHKYQYATVTLRNGTKYHSYVEGAEDFDNLVTDIMRYRR